MSLRFFPQETPVSCTVACLRMVFAHYDIIVDETTLYVCCRTTMQGTRASDAVACARSYGLLADERREVQWNDVRMALSAGIYPIIMLNLFPLAALWVMHAVVLQAFDEQHVHYLDPVYGAKSADIIAFDQAWTMKQRRAIVIRRS